MLITRTPSTLFHVNVSDKDGMHGQGLFAANTGSQGLNMHPLLMSDAASEMAAHEAAGGFLGTETLASQLQTASSVDSELRRAGSAQLPPSGLAQRSEAEREGIPQYSSSIAVSGFGFPPKCMMLDVVRHS